MTTVLTVVAPILLLLLLAVPAGVVMVAVGLRGRRVDDHPLCRRCRFDLTGLPASSAGAPSAGATSRPARASASGTAGDAGG